MAESNERERELACEFDGYGNNGSIDRHELADLLAAYREELMAPASVCDAFERLVRPRGYDEPGRVTGVWWHGFGVTLERAGSDDACDVSGKTLSVAYANLTHARDTTPPSTPERDAELAQNDVDTVAAMGGGGSDG